MVLKSTVIRCKKRSTTRTEHFRKPRKKVFYKIFLKSIDDIIMLVTLSFVLTRKAFWRNTITTSSFFYKTWFWHFLHNILYYYYIVVDLLLLYELFNLIRKIKKRQSFIIRFDHHVLTIVFLFIYLFIF